MKPEHHIGSASNVEEHGSFPNQANKPFSPDSHQRPAGCRIRQGRQPANGPPDGAGAKPRYRRPPAGSMGPQRRWPRTLTGGPRRTQPPGAADVALVPGPAM